ncbi:unnamed protein product (macronuclear) [Paramecium tetraurelia]|uniref:Trichocyst matrix protein n=1 Tax=Paramecium tetraurelia TaxID=5888 RepID=A0CK21_PARTE|nr:uncharacterized protein GSPATT00000850001 [Paramecium tetraurelia]CAK71138.1 unnamed protein product [Paramecium tetraurelia]|eukprot:XP_001438535.1 hypothetical protein (macronuclear) [Paramecium tetraurelia strain d4-2]
MKTLLLLLVIGVMCQNEVDTVEKLLADLKGASAVELTALNTDYTVSKNLKENIIFNLGKAYQEQNFLCASRDKSVSDRESDIDKTNKYIAYLQKRLVDNSNRIQTLDANRCTHSSNYIERVKNDNMTLRLIIFLRNSLQNLDNNQLNRYGSYVEKFLTMYKTAKMSELVELAHEFAETMFIDWNQVTPSSQGNLNTVKGQLIEMLDDMERYIREQIKNAQNLEITTGVTLADFKGAIDIENEQINYDLSSEQKNLIKLDEQLVQARFAAVSCREKGVALQQQQQRAIEDLKNEEIQYNKNKARLQEELNLFTDVYRIYSTQVGTSEDKFKQRVDDYVNDRKVDSYERSQYSLSDAVRKQVQNE